MMPRTGCSLVVVDVHTGPWGVRSLFGVGLGDFIGVLALMGLVIEALYKTIWDLHVEGRR